MVDLSRSSFRNGKPIFFAQISKVMISEEDGWYIVEVENVVVATFRDQKDAENYLDRKSNKYPLLV